jgi:hypothetical protein
MVSPPATSEAGVHAAGDTKSEHFEPSRPELSAKQFSGGTNPYMATAPRVNFKGGDDPKF